MQEFSIDPGLEESPPPMQKTMCITARTHTRMQTYPTIHAQAHAHTYTMQAQQACTYKHTNIQHRHTKHTHQMHTQ